ncbi:MAG: Gfo/Idh/MocA family oxidoreductase [Verrucomicrobiales bacterium]|nr:Gfo/Idh/MocA family oxidoreductase [Verrucomicrobiales bacterium]
MPAESFPASHLSRRQFLARATTATTTGAALLAASRSPAAAGEEKVRIGLTGCGGRGRWITNLFRKHGGYEVAAVHDYFQERADSAGAEFDVPAARRFAGLSGFQRLLEQNLDAVVIQTPPFFHPTQAAAAVEARKHVYLAKPVAVDVPGCQSIEASGRQSTANKRCFLVDFQTRAHPAYQEVARWIHQGRIGRVLTVESNYQTSTMFAAMGQQLAKDPKNPELRLRCWAIDRVLSGDVITEQNIHAQDVVTWFLDAAPLKAVGTGGLARGFGTCWDHFSVIYTFPNGVINTFNSKQVGHAYDDILCRVYGLEGTADTHYFGEVWVKSKEDGFNGGKLANLYMDGAVNNISSFHKAIVEGDCSNPTVAPSVRSNLTTILGRTAAYAKGEVTWEEMMRKSEKWEFPLSDLVA